MIVKDVVFQIPVPNTEANAPNFSRIIKQGSFRDPAGRDYEFSIKLDIQNRVVIVRELNSGDESWYPFEVVSRIRVGNPENAES